MRQTYQSLLRVRLEQTRVETGQTWGFLSTGVPITVPSGNGEPDMVFGPGLVGASLPSRSGNLLAASGADSGQLSFELDGTFFNITELRRQRVRFEEGIVELWWWRPGQTLEQATKVWTGRIDQVTARPRTNRVSISVKVATREVNVVFPPNRIGDAGRFPGAPERSLSRSVPVVYGRVRGLPLYAVDNFEESPPAALGTVRWLIAGHRIPTNQVITVRNEDGTYIQAAAPSHDRDELGNTYAYVETTNAVASGYTDSLTVYAVEVLGHIAPGDTPTNAAFLQGAGDIIKHLLLNWGAEAAYDLDMARIDVAAQHLNRFRIGCYFSSLQSASMIQTLKGRFERQLPVSFNTAGGLLGMDYASIPDGSDSVGRIDFGANCFEVGDFGGIPLSQVRSSFEVSYRLDGSTAGNTASIRRDRHNNEICRATWSRWGDRPSNRLDAPDIWDPQNAALLVDDLVIRQAYRRWRFVYVVDDPLWLTMPLFSRIIVNDPERGLDNVPFLIEGLAPVTSGRVRVNVISEFEL